jgi:hypothetical protein
MLLNTISFAITKVIEKYLLNNWDYWTVFSYVNIGFFLVMLPFIIYYFSDFKELVRKYKSKAIGLMTWSESLSLVGIVLSLQAMSFGFVSLVTALYSLQYLFVFLWILLFSIWFPKIIKEELKGSVIALKLLAIILIISGVFLVT